MRTFIIAEAGVNHNGSIELAKELIAVAAFAKADAVKFQTFQADQLVTASAPKADYQKVYTDVAESQYDMIKKLELTANDHAVLIEFCQQQGIQFLSTPFDINSIDLLINKFNLPTIKIPSGEITNGPLLLRAALTRKKIILSTGMSTLWEIEQALSILAFGYVADLTVEKPGSVNFAAAYQSRKGQEQLKHHVTLLHCTSAYPAPYSDVNLQAMDLLKSTFDLPVGYSDHTLGIEISLAAVARGAVVIEKHFTLDRSLPGPDHQASLLPSELVAMVDSIRNIEKAFGNGLKEPALSELKNRDIARKSVVALQSIAQGEMFSEMNIGLKRPGTGISGFNYWDLLHTAARQAFEKDEVIAEI